ncbi:hypothetical protein DFQ28_010731 [Apophysomyces sp. BC1034]|nr:hypothetical protein DFQ30_010484 [Apophysomyces sp. BC1015]KAG0182720.1 hypothetical protein DFQ29_002640 [Apophysomyces sp. BC1021]KAG0191870.1 hypothetical protein DFQ28_010731 [Apophysomyces sp. BC1034]
MCLTVYNGKHAKTALFADIISCKIKYSEGYVDVFGHIIAKPEAFWSPENQALVAPSDYGVCLGFSLQAGTLLLLQCFWNYLANAVAGARFMSSKEFVFYIAWTFVSIMLFPILQYNFSRDIYDHTYKEIMPQLVYACELFVVAMIGIHSHTRFNKLLSSSQESSNARFITHKIRYFQELNMILSAALSLDSISLIILCADGLTGRKWLNVHKFSADLLICNINVTSIIVWVIVILIFHPKPNNNANNPNSHANQQQQHDFLTPARPDPYGTAMCLQHSQESSTFCYTSITMEQANSNVVQEKPNHIMSPIDTRHPHSVVSSGPPSASTLVSASKPCQGSTDKTTAIQQSIPSPPVNKSTISSRAELAIGVEKNAGWDGDIQQSSDIHLVQSTDEMSRSPSDVSL